MACLLPGIPYNSKPEFISDHYLCADGIERTRRRYATRPDFSLRGQRRWLAPHTKRRRAFGLDAVSDRPALLRRYKALYEILQDFIISLDPDAPRSTLAIWGSLYRRKAVHSPKCTGWRHSDRKAGEIQSNAKQRVRVFSWRKTVKNISPASVLIAAVVIAALTTASAEAYIHDLKVEETTGYYGLEFTWRRCDDCDFIQIIFDRDGRQGSQIELGKEQTKYTVATGSRPMSYVFAIQSCRRARFPDAGGSRCSGWQRIVHAPPPAPPPKVFPSNLQASLRGWWEAHGYLAKVVLVWQPPQNIARLVVVGDPYGFWQELPANSTTFTTSIYPGVLYAFAVCEYGVSPRTWQMAALGCTRTTVQLPLPPPRAPTIVSISQRLPEGIHFAWIGDNVTEWFEIERWELPVATAVKGLPPRTTEQPGSASASAAARRVGADAARIGGTAQAPARAHPGVAKSTQGGTISGAPSTPAQMARVPVAPPSQWVQVGRSITGTRNANARYQIDHVTSGTNQYRVCAVSKAGRACSDPAMPESPQVHQSPGVFR